MLARWDILEHIYYTALSRFARTCFYHLIICGKPFLFAVIKFWSKWSVQDIYIRSKRILVEFQSPTKAVLLQIDLFLIHSVLYWPINQSFLSSAVSRRLLCDPCICSVCVLCSFVIDNKYRLKRKEKNKSREEIFYQMKVFFVKISCRKCFL